MSRMLWDLQSLSDFPDQLSDFPDQNQSQDFSDFPDKPTSKQYQNIPSTVSKITKEIPDFWEAFKAAPIYNPIGANITPQNILDVAEPFAKRTGEFAKNTAEFGGNVLGAFALNDFGSQAKLVQGATQPFITAYSDEEKAKYGDDFFGKMKRGARLGGSLMGFDPNTIEEDWASGNIGGLAGDILPPIALGALMHKVGAEPRPEQPLLRGIDPKGMDIKARPSPFTMPESVDVRSRAMAAIDSATQAKIFELQIQKSEATRVGDYSKVTALDNEILQEKMRASAEKNAWQPESQFNQGPEPIQQGFPDLYDENVPLDQRGGVARETPFSVKSTPEITPEITPEVPEAPTVSTPRVGEGQPRIVTLKSPDNAILQYYLNQGYKKIGVGPEGYPQLVRGDLAPLYSSAETRPTPEVGVDVTASTTPPVERPLNAFEQAMRSQNRPDLPGPPTGGTTFRQGEPIKVPTASLTDEIIADYAENGYHEVNRTRDGYSIFEEVPDDAGFLNVGDIADAMRDLTGHIKRFIKDDTGTFDPTGGTNRLRELITRMAQNMRSGGARAIQRATTHEQLDALTRQWEAAYNQGRENRSQESMNIATEMNDLIEQRAQELGPRRHPDEFTIPEPITEPIPTADPHAEFTQRVANATDASEATRLHTEAYNNFNEAYARQRAHQESGGPRWYEDRTHSDEMNRWRERMTEASDRQSEFIQTDREARIARQASDQEIIRRADTDIDQLPQITTTQELHPLRGYWTNVLNEARDVTGDSTMMRRANRVIGAINERALEIEGGQWEAIPEDPLTRPSIHSAHETRILNARSASEVNRIVGELQRTFPDEIHTQAGRDLLDLANRRIAEIVGNTHSSIAPPAPRGQADWSMSKYGRTEPVMAEEGPLPAELGLPFDEELNPRAIIDESVPSTEGTTRSPKEDQRNLQFKVGLTQAQIDRINANVEPSRYQNRRVGPESSSTWRGFGEDVARAAKDGPPGLRVEKGYTGKNIVFRNSEGKPLVVAKLDIARDGGLGIRALGKDTTVGSTRAVNEAVGLVLEHAARMDAALPVGSFSEYTAALLKNASRRVVPNDAGFINIGDILDAVRETGKKVSDLAGRLFREDAGTVDFGEMFKKVKDKTGWGQGISKPTKNTREINFIDEALALPSAATTTGDLSAPGKQGISQILTPEFWKAIPKMFGGMSAEGFKRIDNAIHDLPAFRKEIDPQSGKIKKSLAEEAKVSMYKLASDQRVGQRAEAVASKWLETGGNIPYLSKAYRETVGKPIRMSNRAFITFQNYLKANRFQKLVDLSRDMSITGIEQGRIRNPGASGWLGMSQKITPEAAMDLNPYHNLQVAREIGDFVNTATGQAPLKMHWLPGKAKWMEMNFEGSSKAMSRLLFSPGLLFSRMRMLNPNTYIMASPFVRKQYLKAAVSTAAAWYVSTNMMKMYGSATGEDVEVNDDWTSADFGKVRIGDTRLDPGGGFLQFLVAYGRVYNGGSTSSSTGQFHPFGEGYQAQTQESTMQRFFVNKLNPATKFAYDLLDAKQYNPFHVYDRTAQLFTPLIAQDLYELAKERPDLLPSFGAAAMMGMGTQTYEKGESVGKLVNPENDWLVKGGGLKDLMPWNWNQ